MRRLLQTRPRLALLIAILLAMRFLPYRPVNYTNIEDQFKYGSTGGERNAGFPYWIWQALPVVFQDKLPHTGRPGYEAFGFVYEACWPTAPSGPVRGGGCVGLDAQECSRHDDCVAQHDSDWSACPSFDPSCDFTASTFLSSA